MKTEFTLKAYRDRRKLHHEQLKLLGISFKSLSPTQKKVFTSKWVKMEKAIAGLRTFVQEAMKQKLQKS